VQLEVANAFTDYHAACVPAMHDGYRLLRHLHDQYAVKATGHSIVAPDWRVSAGASSAEAELQHEHPCACCATLWAMMHQAPITCQPKF
jgi:hypothetical protein